MKTYELTTVTYGTVSAPYLATRTLKQLAMDEANNFPLADPVVMSDCYMDDILSGSESIEEWHHIASEQNPANVLSRGLLPEEPRDDSPWRHGPELPLQSAYSTSVIEEPTQRDDFDCELTVFIDNCRSKVKKRGPLNTNEVNDAETWLIKQDQSGINLSDPSGNLKSLNTFQDDKGVLRVGERPEKASIPYSQKHPAILAKNSKLSKIYFITLHKKLFHVGPQGLLNAVRLRWL
ncbi:integrase catalytic domain-containing protein [Trichonephila clavipes]|nr:integrase catalytic domain-containing protein [Trichonephila clavipes]